MADNGEQLFSEFADITALEEQKKEILSIFLQVKQGIKDLSDAGLKIDKAQGLGSMSAALKSKQKAQDELTLSIEEYNRILTQNAKIQAAMDAAQSEQGKKLSQLKVQQQQLNKENREAAKDALGMTDAYGKLAKDYEIAARNAQNLIKTKGKDNEETKKAVALAQRLGSELKDIDAQVLKFQRNVGNYANSLSDGFELVRREISRLQRDQKAFTIGGDTRSAEAAGLRIKELDEIIRVSFDDSKNFDQVVKSLQKSFSTMAASGEHSNEFLQEFAKFVANAKDQSEDLKQEIKALSSDTRKLDLAAGAVSFLADSMQLAAGAAQLAGASEEDAAAATAKLVAIQSVANGLKGAATELTTKGTAANKVYAFVQGLVSVSLDKTATSAAKAKAALGLLGIAVTIVGAIVIALAQLSKAQSDAAIKQKNLNDVMKDAGSEYAKAIEQVNSLRINIDLAREGVLKKKDVIDQYNESMGKVTGQAKTLDEVEQQLNKNADAYIAFTYAKAIATAALAKAAQLAVDAQLELLDPSNQGKRDVIAINPFLSDKQKQSFIAGLKKDTEEKRAALAKQSTDLIAFAKEQQLNAGKIAKENKFSFTGSFGDKTSTKKEADNRRQTLLEVKKIELEAAADIQAQILKIESFSFAERHKALKEYIRLKTEIINNDRRIELQNKGLTNEQIKQIEEEGKLRVNTSKITNEELLLLETKRLDDLHKLSEEALSLFTITTKEAVEEAATALDEMDAISDKIRDKIGYKLEQEIKKTLGILTDAQIEAIKKLHEAADQEKLLNEIKDTYVDTFQSIADASGSIIENLFERQRNLVQQQIDDIERLKNAEIERATQQQLNADGSIVTEEQKAARIKIIEAKAQVDRERLEARQRQIDRQKAVAAKLFNVFQLTIDGLQAVAKVKFLAQIARAEALINPLALPAAALAQAQVLQTIITSTAAVALAAAQPLPKLFRGKKASDPYVGPAVVADAGRELKISASGDATLFDKETVTDIKKGDTVLPNYLTELIMRTIAQPVMLTHSRSAQQVINISDNKEIVEQLEKLNSKPPIVIYNQSGIESTAWYDYHMKH